MNIKELKNAVQYIQKKCKCTSCKRRYRHTDIYVIATTASEGLFEVHCPDCHITSILTVINTAKESMERLRPTINENTISSEKIVSQNDILDMKNFLNNFDGNFKKYFNA